MDPIILASQSPRRKQLLEWAGIDFKVMVSEADESYPPGMLLEEIPVHIARKKADAVQSRINGHSIIVAADTVVVLGETQIGKPMDREDAIRILSALSGNRHTVITGVVIRQASNEISFSDSTEVWFHELTIEQIEYYVDHYSPYDKAGAYAIQEWIGVVGIRCIQGDFYNVMGLPISRVIKALDGMGWRVV
jgi:septum formation protein